MKIKHKRKKRKRNLGTIIGILGLVFTIGSLLYAFIIGPTKRDIKNIKLFLESYVRSKSDSSEILSSGIPADLENRIKEIEEDVANVESSKIFSLGSDNYIKLSEFYFNYFNLNKSFEYVNKALKKNPLNFRAKLLLSIIEFYQGNFSAAIEDAEYVKKLLKMKEVDEEKIIIVADLIQSMSSLFMGDPSRSITYIEHSASLLVESKDYRAINIFNYYFLAENYLDINDYDKGDYYYKHYVELKKDVLKKNDIDKLSKFLLAFTALEEDPSSAILLVNDLLNDDQRNNLLIMLKNCLLSIMEVKENKYKEAYRYLTKNVEISSSLGSNLIESLSRYMIFMVKLEGDKYIDEITLEALEKGKSRIPFLDGDVYKAIAEFYNERKDYPKAKEYFTKCLELYNKVGIMDEVVHIHADMYLLELNIKNYYNAYENVSSALKCINDIFKKNKHFIIDESTDNRIKKKLIELVEIERILKEAKGNLEKIFGFKGNKIYS